MNWRWISVVLACFLTIEVVVGFAAYGSKSWNLARTEVITGWPAVREICLIFMPTLFGAVAVGITMTVLAIRWAMRGGE